MEMAILLSGNSKPLEVRLRCSPTLPLLVWLLAHKVLSEALTFGNPEARHERMF